MYKKALIGKILLIFGILFIIVIAITGITIWQIYDIVKTAQQETSIIERNQLELKNGNCSKIEEIEISMKTVVVKIENACKNPIIKYGARKIKNLPANCENVKSLYRDLEENLELNRKVCEFKANINNKTMEDFLELEKEIEEFKNRTQH